MLGLDRFSKTVVRKIDIAVYSYMDTKMHTKITKLDVKVSNKGSGMKYDQKIAIALEPIWKDSTIHPSLLMSIPRGFFRSNSVKEIE